MQCHLDSGTRDLLLPSRCWDNRRIVYLLSNGTKVVKCSYQLLGIEIYSDSSCCRDQRCKDFQVIVRIRDVQHSSQFLVLELYRVSSSCWEKCCTRSQVVARNKEVQCHKQLLEEKKCVTYNCWAQRSSVSQVKAGNPDVQCSKQLPETQMKCVSITGTRDVQWLTQWLRTEN